MLAVERSSLRPLPISGFESRRVELADANSLSLVRFDGNDYSVPTAFAHHPITVIGGLDEVRLVCQDRLVARHWSELSTSGNHEYHAAEFLVFGCATGRD